MPKENREEYFRTLIIQPPHYSSYNESDCEVTTATKSVFCNNERAEDECDTESEVSVHVTSTSNDPLSNNETLLDKNYIHCATVPVKKVKGNYLAVLLTVCFF